ncbi:DUF488 family protein [Scytonema sp. NUACC26]|uniref:DUF488 domain-containing protein n=1 Tax=Scytonema sp. NUACC26 TaxID=3140176 RepID=UPI0034DC0159
MENNEYLVANKDKLTLFTIGYSNHSISNFIALLKNNNISCVVDVRSTPYSKYYKSFDKENLLSELSINKIDYIWMGETLGGRRNDLKTSMGFRQDEKYDTDIRYNEALLELMYVAISKPTVLMCSEEDPRRCHRHKIIAHSLLHKNFDSTSIDNIHIIHIRASGKLENASLIETYFQPSLF